MKFQGRLYCWQDLIAGDVPSAGRTIRSWRMQS
jgi:hypothetical protein